jgi:hypothetical protein
MSEFNFTYPVGNKSIEGFVIDAFLAEHYSFSNSVTEIPVEDGSSINDHVTEVSDEISVKAFIGKAEFVKWEGEYPKSQDDITEADPKARIINAYQTLLKLKRDRQPVEVAMGLDTFSDMIITSFEIERDVRTGADLPFDMTFKKLNKVKSEATKINAYKLDQTGGTANVGPVATKDVPPEDIRMHEAWIRGYRAGLCSREQYLDECKQWSWVPRI